MSFEPGLLVNRDSWLFFLAGLVLLLGASAGLVFGHVWLSGWASSAGAAVYLLAVPGVLVLGTAYLLGFGFVGFPFLESEWYLSRSILSVALGLGLGALYWFVVEPQLDDLAFELTLIARGVVGGLAASLVLYTGLSKLSSTLPAILARPDDD